MCFGRFNLFANSYQFIWTKWPSRASPLFNLRLLELVGIAFYWTWFTLLVKAIPGNGTKIMFVLISFAVTSPLHVQIVLSHFSQPVSVDSEIVQHAELIESHAHRQLRTTMDISVSFSSFTSIAIFWCLLIPNSLLVLSVVFTSVLRILTSFTVD